MAQQVAAVVMDSFTGKLAVVTGGGPGKGRELARQPAAQGRAVGRQTGITCGG